MTRLSDDFDRMAEADKGLQGGVGGGLELLVWHKPVLRSGLSVHHAVLVHHDSCALEARRIEEGERQAVGEGYIRVRELRVGQWIIRQDSSSYIYPDHYQLINPMFETIVSLGRLGNNSSG